MPGQATGLAARVGLSWGAAVLAAIGCGGSDVTEPATGSIEVTTITHGPEPDLDGYAISIDNGTAVALGSNATSLHQGVDAGTHSIQLSGLAANCTVAGENPRTTSVVAEEMTMVTFTVTCVATTGSLQITATTSGPAPDPDGYSLTLDGTDRGPIAVGGSITLDRLTAGSHSVGLSGVAANCQVDGDNPRSASLTAGAIATVAFTVTCAALPPVAGSVRITTQTTGPNPDADGYTFTLDGEASQPIGVNASATLANVAAGQHTVQLSGLAATCTVQGTNPRPVTVSAGATAEVGFAVSCSATAAPVLRVAS